MKKLLSQTFESELQVYFREKRINFDLKKIILGIFGGHILFVKKVFVL